MDAQIDQQQVNKCPNCGGDLELNFASHTYKCSYCGSEFNYQPPKKKVADALKKTGKAVDDDRTGILTAQFTRENFADKMLTDINSVASAPANIFSATNFGKPKLLYLPFYFIEYQYSGNWKYFLKQQENSLTKALANLKPQELQPAAQSEVNGKVAKLFAAVTPSNTPIAAENLSLPEKDDSSTQAAVINVHRGATGSNAGIASSPVGTERYYIYNDLLNCASDVEYTLNDIKPFNEVLTADEVCVNFQLSVEDIWKNQGKEFVLSDIEYKIRDSNVDVNRNNLDITLNCEPSQIIKFYIPVWSVTNMYRNEPFHYIMNAVNGNLIGEKVIDRKLVFEPTDIITVIGLVLLGMFILFPIYIAITMPILLSKKNDAVTGVFAVTGFLFCVFIYPWLHIKYIRPTLNRRRNTKALAQRNSDLNKLIST